MFDPVEKIHKSRRRGLAIRTCDICNHAPCLTTGWCQTCRETDRRIRHHPPPQQARALPDEWHSMSMAELWGRLNDPTRFWPEKPGTNGVRVYEPPTSLMDATLWIRKYAPERLDDWLDRHDRLRQWLDQKK
jgi:hypothetical protein